jgi:hypothetical protein
VNSKIAANITGHLKADPRIFNLRNGVGCELRVTIALRGYDDDGVPVSRERRVKVVTYDTQQADDLARNYSKGDFVQILADDIRVEKAWQNNAGQWVSGSAVFPLTRIRKITALTPEDGQATSAAARADASVLDGVTAIPAADTVPAAA